MKNVIAKLENLLEVGSDFIQNTSEENFSKKPTNGKWSKKEILGHLIDSAVNNLRRFTEIQFSPLPYPIIPYNQSGLVDANNYNEADTQEILNCWLSVNKRIIAVMDQQTEETLSLKIKLPDTEISDLKFLMEDYVDHMEHHINQITLS